MSKDIEFASSLTQAWMDKDSKAAQWLLFTLVCLFFAFIVWAAYLELDVLTRGTGSVVPSKSIYVVDNLEGGILAELNVEEGGLVTKGQQLLKIDNSSYLAALQENTKMQSDLSLTLLRLRAEFSGEALTFADEHGYTVAALASEKGFYQARLQQHYEKRLGYEQQIADSKRELNETRATIARLSAEAGGSVLVFPDELSAVASESIALEQRFYRMRKQRVNDETRRLREALAILRTEYDTNLELEKAGAASKMEVLEIKREMLDTQSRLASLREDFLQQASQELKDRREREIALTKTLSGLESSLVDLDKQRLSDITEEIRTAESELALLQEKQHSLQDKVNRSVVNAPMDGVVNKVHVRNRGAVIQPGNPIVEIVPSTDSLLIEAQIAPQDIAFIRPKQKAIVKVTAYDFAIYGGLDGEVVFISPDTHEDEKGNQFYKVQVKTQKSYIGANTENLIIPGMSVEVDLIAGKRSLLHYLLKPLRRMSEQALREH